MSPTPDPPKPEPINNAALWAKIIGAVIATILFLSFLGLGIWSAMAQTVIFNCATFSFFAPAFAIGAAMAAMFLGGGAAVAGNLGERLQGQALTVSLTGGVAVLLIMFGVFFMLRPAGCGEERQETLLEFRAVPDAVSVLPGPGLWTRKNTHDQRNVHEVFVLIAGQVSEEEVVLMQDGVQICTVRLSFDAGFPPESEFLDYDVMRMTGPPVFKLDYVQREGGELVEAESCFRHGPSGRRVELELAVATDTREIRFARRKAQDAPSVLDFAGGSGGLQSLIELRGAVEPFSLIAPAHAASLGMPYGELRELLQSANEQQRVEARRILSQEFGFYADAALADLFDLRTQRNGELLASLLSGLIEGIEAAEPRLAPAAGRDLSLPLPYVAGREGNILMLAAHPDGSVRQQARRLMQRYPVDAFQRDLDLALETAQATADSGACPQDRAGYQTYAAVFYTYNRMVQAGLDGRATDGTDWDGTTDLIQTLAETCIAGVEKADAALLDYGRALAYAWSKDEAASRAAVADFEAYLQGREGDYYLQGHRDRLAELWN